MAIDKYGYRSGVQMPILYGIDSSVTTTIYPGDHVKLATAGYVTVAGAGDNPIGVAMQQVTPGASDGTTSILVDVSEWTIYEYPPDAGSVTVALKGLTCDLGAARSIDIDASADDNIVIVDVDTVNNTVYIRHKYPVSGVA